MEHAKDAQGRLIYRNGKPVWRLTEKGFREAAQGRKGPH